ncbi:MAG: hypothetical protein MZV63_72090 [Marinilabiliales bacterium]|nr:hypothetical protein [Marinilabiliales bacterium]
MELLRDLLIDDGSIWVSIDDNEGHYLKVLMDEILAKEFYCKCSLAKKYLPKRMRNDFIGRSRSLSWSYSKKRRQMVKKSNTERGVEKQDKAYKNVDDDPRGLWQPSDLTSVAEASEKRLLIAITNTIGK